MLSTYFTKVEDKFVFNVALLFWHMLVLLAALAIVVGIAMFIWGSIPASKPTVVEQAYPEQPVYPEPVRVSLEELKVDDIQQSAALLSGDPSSSDPVQAAPRPKSEAAQEDFTGLKEYEAELDRMKALIPPATYSWEGQGYWYYPMGERYWTFYQQERFRQWVVTAPGFEDVLKQAFARIKARKYSDKQRVLSGLNAVAQELPESERMRVVKDLLVRLSDDLDLNVRTHEALAKGVRQIGSVANYGYVRSLAEFGVYNPSDLVEFASYLGTTLLKFREDDRPAILNRVIDSYYRIFDRNLGQLKEATDMFLQLLKSIDPNLHVHAITKYHSLYLNKNQRRNQEIARINQDYQRNRAAIDEANRQAHLNAETSRMRQQHEKAEASQKSVYAVGAGILVVIVVATVLVFFSIQRLVKRIEQRLPLTSDSNG